jgi:hypothetical protein
MSRHPFFLPSAGADPVSHSPKDPHAESARRHDLSNLAKTLWVLAIFIFPLLGVLAYLLIRGHVMHSHQVRDQQRLGSVRLDGRAGPVRTSADDLHTLADRHERGLLDNDEYSRAKALQ